MEYQIENVDDENPELGVRVSRITREGNHVSTIVDADMVDIVTKSGLMKMAKIYVVLNLDKPTYLHRFVLGMDDKGHVDHINHDTFDNRRCNLRRVTHSQNHMNRKRRSNNKTGVIGVHRKKNRPGYIATLVKDGKFKLHKYFRCFEDAVNARLEAEIEYHGQYAFNACK